MRWAGPVARMGREEEYIYRILTGKPEGKRPLGRPRLGTAVLARTNSNLPNRQVVIA
jgi:hypothetical protein